MSESVDHAPPHRCFALREYEAAAQTWLGEAVDQTMRGLDPVFAAIPRRETQWAVSSMVTSQSGETMKIPPFSVHAETEASIASAINGRLSNVHEIVLSVAEQMIGPTMSQFFATLSEVSEFAGTSVDAQGNAIEGLIASIEAMDVTFYEDGSPNLQIVANPETAERIREQLDNASPEQLERLNKTLERKRRENDATRRSRKLPRRGK